MNKQEAFKIVETALMNYINDSAGKDSDESKEIQVAFDNLARIDKLLEQRIEREKSENTVVREFLYGGHFGRKYYDFPDSTLYIGTAFEVGGAYEDWGFVVKKWSEGKLKTIAAHRDLKGVIEKAIRNLNQE